jgi:hypothetical protein
MRGVSKVMGISMKSCIFVFSKAACYTNAEQREFLSIHFSLGAMKTLLRYLLLILLVESAFAQNGNSVQKPETWNLTIVEALMYPGSSVQLNQTVIASYDWQAQCESARRIIQARFNSSAQCILKKKTKVSI